MSVTSVDKDFDNLTLTFVAEFAAPVERVWQLWADPRLLERWWGPPTYPATFEQHDLEPGGTVTYCMTGPDGAKYRGWWEVTAVAPPSSLEFTDGFAGDDGTPRTDMPLTTVRMRLTDHGGGTRMHVHSAFASREDMQQLLDMGTAEGMEQAMGQMDELLAG
jgi:uncharacterized protein YndB with AHSA1/START domain